MWRCGGVDVEMWRCGGGVVEMWTVRCFKICL